MFRAGYSPWTKCITPLGQSRLIRATSLQWVGKPGPLRGTFVARFRDKFSWTLIFAFPVAVWSAAREGYGLFAVHAHDDASFQHIEQSLRIVAVDRVRRTWGIFDHYHQKFFM